MGLFDKLKSAATVVTGGGAEVNLEIDNVDRGTPIGFRVDAVAKTDLQVKAVYLLVRATEHAEFYQRHEREVERAYHISFDDRIQVAGPQQLKAGQSYAWEGEFTLPEDVGPSLYGEIIRHIWTAQAGLDTVGNDPDSGWLEFEVY